MPEREFRELDREVKSRVVLYQKRAGMQLGLWAEMLEADAGVHSNLIFPDPDRLVGQRIAASEKFAQFDDERGTFLRYMPIRTLHGWMNYRLGECTSKAHFAGNREFPRMLGRHPLGEGGGDRLRLSEDLERILLDSGKMKPRRRTYASRSLPKKPPPAPPAWTVSESGQLQLFAPAVAEIRLPGFWSGKMPPAVANDIEAIRKARGWTQAEMARHAGVSRPQYVNAVVGRFGLSRQPVVRLQALLLEAA